MKHSITLDSETWNHILLALENDLCAQQEEIEETNIEDLRAERIADYLGHYAAYEELGTQLIATGSQDVYIMLIENAYKEEV